METGRQNKEGRLQISSKALKKIVWYAAMEVDAVADICVCESDSYNIMHLLAPKSPIMVELKNGVVDVDLSLVLYEQENLTEVCEKVQQNIKNAIQNMSAITVGHVNVTVGGLVEREEE